MNIIFLYKQLLTVILLCTSNVHAALPAVTPPPSPLATETPVVPPPPPPTVEAPPATITAPATPLPIAPASPAVTPTPPTPSSTETPVIPPPVPPTAEAPSPTTTAPATPLPIAPASPVVTPTPPTPPSTETPAIPPPVPTVTTTSSTPTTPTNSAAAQSYKTEVDEINTLLQNISASKTHLKELLASVDSDISTAKGLVGEARKKSLDIMTKHTEETAKATEIDIQQKLVTVTELRKKIAEATAKAFQDENNKIQESMKQITGIIEKLKTKGASFKITQAQEQQKATTTAEASTQKPTTLPKSWIADDKQGDSKAITAAEQPSKIHYIFHHIATAISKVVRFGYVFYRGCKAALWEGVPAPKVIDSTPGSFAHALPSTAVQKTVPEQVSQKTDSVAALESNIAPLTAIRADMIQIANNIEQQINLLSHTLASNKAIGLAVQSDLMLFTPLQQRPAWRRTAEEYFNACLDSCNQAYQKAKDHTARMYHTYIGPMFYKVQRDLAHETAQKSRTQANQLATSHHLSAQNG